MKVGFLQFAPKLHDEQYNLDTISSMLSDYAADLVVLPELCTSGYLFTSKDQMIALASPAEGRIPLFFKDLAHKEQLTIAAGFLESEGDKLYNSQIIASPDGKQIIYRKVHLFNDEKDYFQPGNSGFKIFELHKTTLGMMICFDWIFPESARTLAVMGADIICHSANLVLPFCQKAMATRSIENGVFTITANRVGSDKIGDACLSFTGMSQITDPKGTVLIQAGNNEEIVKFVEINPEEARNKYITDKNHLLDDRRKKFYKT
ncbi:MAG TPA: hypothetical protein ENK03_04080 [Candidatus Cloacimonetes bacterium]|nr:hypothetical protein [Candidatus Cloacimonadota bacterium]